MARCRSRRCACAVLAPASIRAKLHDGAHDNTRARLPRLARVLAEEEDALAVGDWCWPRPTRTANNGARSVPPQTRPCAAMPTGRHPVVANVDTALLVMGLDADFNLRRMERFLALVQAAAWRR